MGPYGPESFPERFRQSLNSSPIVDFEVILLAQTAIFLSNIPLFTLTFWALGAAPHKELYKALQGPPAI